MPAKGQIIPLREKFDRLVMRRDGCWGWTAAKVKGYGALTHLRQSLRAHRVAFELFVGPIPEGMCVLHKCDNPECSNPEHLFLGTHADNVADKIAKRRQARADRHGSKTKPERYVFGEQHNRAKLTNEAVALVRTLGRKGWKHNTIAQIVGCSRSNVGQIINGKHRVLELGASN